MTIDKYQENNNGNSLICSTEMFVITAEAIGNVFKFSTYDGDMCIIIKLCFSHPAKKDDNICHIHKTFDKISDKDINTIIDMILGE